MIHLSPRIYKMGRDLMDDLDEFTSNRVKSPVGYHVDLYRISDHIHFTIWNMVSQDVSLSNMMGMEPWDDDV